MPLDHTEYAALSHYITQGIDIDFPAKFAKLEQAPKNLKGYWLLRNRLEGHLVSVDRTVRKMLLVHKRGGLSPPGKDSYWDQQIFEYCRLLQEESCMTDAMLDYALGENILYSTEDLANIRFGQLKSVPIGGRSRNLGAR
jgi:hypothetical protein